MSPHREASPSEEYDRLQTERCVRAFQQVQRWYLLTIIPYVGSFAVGLWSGAPLWAFPAVFFVFYLFAVVTGVVTFRNWPLLSWEKRLYGLAPWAFCLLVSLPFVLKMLQ